MMWMNLENIMLSEISQTQKDEYYMVPHMQNNWNRQIHKDRKIRGYWGWRERGMRNDCLLITEVLFRVMKTLGSKQW